MILITDEKDDSQGFRAKWLSTARAILTIGFVAILTALILQPSVRSQFIESIRSLSLLYIGCLTILFVLMRGAQALSLKHVLSIYDQRVRLNSALHLAGLKGLFNLGFTGLGIVAQSAQAKIQFLVPVRVMLFANVTQSFMLIGALGLCLLVATVFFFESIDLPMPMVFLGAGIGAGLLGLTGASACLFSNPLAEKARTMRAFRLLLPPQPSHKPAWDAVIGLGVLQIVLVVLRAARVLVIAYAISPAVSIDSLTVTVLAADTLGVIPITPGGIGVRELFIGMLGATVEHYEVFLSAAIIDRVLTITFNLIHGSFAVWDSGRVRNFI